MSRPVSPTSSNFTNNDDSPAVRSHGEESDKHHDRRSSQENLVHPGNLVHPNDQNDHEHGPGIPHPAATVIPSLQHNGTSTSNGNWHPQKLKRLHRLSRKKRKASRSSLQAFAGWEAGSPPKRQPYHDYVHNLVEVGWENLHDLDKYMGTDIEDSELVISVVDITAQHQIRRWPDIHDSSVLKDFIGTRDKAKDGSKVRLYLAEQKGNIASSVMEAFGSSLSLDPRFFQWSIHGSRHVFTPSERHRSPYLSIGFGVLKKDSQCRTDTENFPVLVYVLPDKEGDGWTGILLFGSHTKVHMSSRVLIRPPMFGQVPERTQPDLVTFRELYLETLKYLDLEQAVQAPFYAFHYLFRLNYLCWNQIVTTVHDEDKRVRGISDSNIGHAEEISKTLNLIRRCGSRGWRHGGDFAFAQEDSFCVSEPDAKLGSHKMRECQRDLQEDFQNLVKQTNMIWENREKFKTIRQSNSDARWSVLTNAFTYMFVLPSP